MIEALFLWKHLVLFERHIDSFLRIFRVGSLIRDLSFFFFFLQLIRQFSWLCGAWASHVFPLVYTPFVLQKSLELTGQTVYVLAEEREKNEFSLIVVLSVMLTTGKCSN